MRSTTGSPRKCDLDAPVEQPLFSGVGGKPEVLGRLDAVEQRRKQQRLCEARIAPAPAPRIEVAVAPGGRDCRPDRGPALGVRVEQQA